MPALLRGEERKREVCFDSTLTGLHIHMIHLDLMILKFQVHTYLIWPEQYTTSCPYHAWYARVGSYYSDTTSPALSTSPLMPTSTTWLCLMIHTWVCQWWAMQPWILPWNRKCSCSHSCQSAATQFWSGAETHKSPPWLCLVLHAMHCKSSSVFLPPFLCWCNTSLCSQCFQPTLPGLP
jgi:hypothetical protein